MMKRFLLVFAVIVLALPTFAQKSAAQIAGEKLREKWMNQKAPEFVVEKWLTKEPKVSLYWWIFGDLLAGLVAN